MQLKGIHLQQGLESSRMGSSGTYTRFFHDLCTLSEHDVEMHSGEGA